MRRGQRHEFFEWTDLFRVAAATLVTLSHARDVMVIDYSGQKLWRPFYASTGLGRSGVILFFVLSGFWISRSVLRRIDGSSFWPGYLINRLSRLGIVLLPALIFGGLLDLLGAVGLHLPAYRGLTGAHSMMENVMTSLTAPVFLGNLAFLQTIVVPPWGSNGPLWSLAYEFWYYLWFAALALLVVRRRPSVALLALLVGVANPDMYWGFISWLVGWGLLHRVEHASDVPAGPWWAALAALFFTAVLVVTAAFRTVWFDPVLSLSFGLLLLALVRSATPFPRLLVPLARYGRRGSFSLYAIHFPIVALVGGWATGGARMAPGWRALALVLALTGLCLLAGWCFAQGTEAFTPRLREWLRQRLLVRAQPSRV